MSIPRENYTPSVLVDTANLSEEDWLEWRRKGIGGSDAAAILGISPFGTARDLYYDKLKILPIEVNDDNWVQKEIGHLLEDAVLHYLNCSETPNIPQSLPIDTKLIEAVVERIMAKQKATGNTNEVKSATKATVSQEISIDDIADTLGEEGLNAIANTMAMFRQD